MARFFDKVGFAPTSTFVDGVWSGDITERAYKGELLEASRSLQPSDKVEDDIRLQNRVRIVGDAFALENFANIRYVLWRGTRWTVGTVTVTRPELLLTLGGVYDGSIPGEIP